MSDEQVPETDPVTLAHAVQFNSVVGDIDKMFGTELTGSKLIEFVKNNPDAGTRLLFTLIASLGSDVVMENKMESSIFEHMLDGYAHRVEILVDIKPHANKILQ